MKYANLLDPLGLVAHIADDLKAVRPSEMVGVFDRTVDLQDLYYAIASRHGRTKISHGIQATAFRIVDSALWRRYEVL